ncbi:MAG: DUF3800 domain-containing protein [Nitrosospira sp.]|nr:DUF3800 domain-containing protein [Nitrosospira sp.]
MQILFVDESGTPPPFERQSTTPLFVLGGVVVPEDYWAKLAADLGRLKDHFSIKGEIKWRYFAPDKPGSKKHSLSHLSSAHKEELRTKLYQMISGYKSIRLICVATNVPLAYQQNYIANADDLYWYSYKQLTERFQYYLQDLQRTVGQHVNGIVVCDHRGPKDDSRLRELHQQLLDGKRSNYSNYLNLIEGLFIAPSHLSVGIQLADMVAGAVFRHYRVGDDRFFRQIEGSFRKSPAGNIHGFGLVKFPKNGW